MQAIIFDLDDTLIPDTASLTTALLLTGTEAQQRFGVEPAALAKAVLRHAEELWAAAPTAGYCDRMGIVAAEGLASDFFHPSAYDPALDRVYLREWAPSYRHHVWKLALDDFDVGDWMPARELAERFRDIRFESHVAASGAHELLDGLAEKGYTLAVLTNGPGDMQRQKLLKSGLRRHFDDRRTFISGDIGLGKPNPDLFRMVLERLSVEPREAVMVGDNPQRDVYPALGCGMAAVWMRNGRGDDLVRASVPRVDTLAEIPSVIQALEVGGA